MSAAEEAPAWTARHFLLIAATLCTTFYAGLQANGGYHVWRQLRSLPGMPTVPELRFWAVSEAWVPTLLFSLSLFAILFAHEMGHYLTARRAGHRPTPPFFIPFLPPFGTLGAVLMLEERKMPSGTLMRIAAFGPFAGLAVAVPVCILGLQMSYTFELSDSFEGATFGTCLLFQALQWLLHGPLEPGHDVMLHPVALAGWVGCLITGLNMLPFGNLDGGHVAYSLWGRRYNQRVGVAFFVAAALLLALGPQLLFFGFFVYFVVGLKHPDMSTDGVATGADRWIGWIALLVFVLTFTPRPIHVTWGEFFAFLPGFS